MKKNKDSRLEGLVRRGYTSLYQVFQNAVNEAVRELDELDERYCIGWSSKTMALHKKYSKDMRY